MNNRNWNAGDDRGYGRSGGGTDRNRNDSSTSRRSEYGGEDRAEEWRSSSVGTRELGRWESEGGSPRSGRDEPQNRDRFGTSSGYGADRGASSAFRGDDDYGSYGARGYGARGTGFDRNEGNDRSFDRGSWRNGMNEERGYGVSERGWNDADRTSRVGGGQFGGGAHARDFAGGGSMGRGGYGEGRGGEQGDGPRGSWERQIGGSYGPGASGYGASGYGGSDGMDGRTSNTRWNGADGGRMGMSSSAMGGNYGNQEWTSHRQGSQSYGIGGFDSGFGQSQRREGKAPKNYTRSDDRLREEICDCLASSGHDWSDVEVQVSNGEVTLTGNVSDREHKLQAEHMADRVRGVKEVTNQLKVKRAETASATTSATHGTNGTTENGTSNETSSRSRRSSV